MAGPQWHRRRNPERAIRELMEGSERKLRLFNCACARQLWSLLPRHGRAAVETAEDYSDGLLTYDDLDAARKASRLAGSSNDGPSRTAGVTLFASPWSSAMLASSHALGAGLSGQAQCGLLGDLFGAPSGLAIDASWLTSTVVKLAEGLYESRDFAAMPILADALQDAGCEEAHVLDHCRKTHVHVRGCWVIDSVLGRG